LVVRLGVNALASPFPEDLKGNAFICEVPAWISTVNLGIPIVLSACCEGFGLRGVWWAGWWGPGKVVGICLSRITQFSLVTEITPRHVPS